VEQIRELNRSGSYKVYVFAGTECDILTDGSLDYEDSILAQLDYVVASVHSGFSMDGETMTRRILRALENPYVTMLGHPTGRLLLRREAYELDMARIIDAAIANQVIIELNANPYRLDMDWRHWRKAAERGLLCSINPDAHDTDSLSYVSAGVRSARKGWLEARNILTTRSLSEVTQYFAGKKAAACRVK